MSSATSTAAPQALPRPHSFRGGAAYNQRGGGLKPRSMPTPTWLRTSKANTQVSRAFSQQKTNGRCPWLRSRYPYVAPYDGLVVRQQGSSFDVKAVRPVESAPRRRISTGGRKKTASTGRGTREEMKAITMEASKKGMYVGMTPVEDRSVGRTAHHSRSPGSPKRRAPNNDKPERRANVPNLTNAKSS